MTVFIDTSIFLALLDRREANHVRAAATLEQLVGEAADLVTSNYVALETSALVQNRLGLNAVYIFYTNLLPLTQIIWIGEATHRAAMSSLLTASRRKLSLVDCSSFEVMREQLITTAFALDKHFAEQGFKLI